MRTLIALLLIHSLAYAEDGILSSTNDPDKTGRVFDLISDFCVNQDAVLAKRYAFVARGEELRESRGKFSQNPLWFVSARENRNLSFDAEAIGLPSNLSAMSEKWFQQVIKDGRHYVRHGAYRSDATKEFEDAEARDKEHMRIRFLKPFHQVHHPANCISTQSAKNELTTLFKPVFVLKKGVYEHDGDITAEFFVDMEHDTTIVLRFDKDDSFRLTEVKHFMSPLSKNMYLVSHCKTKWQTIKDGLYVPLSLDAIYTHISRDTSTYFLKYDWKFDDDLPETMIDVDDLDWRERLRVHFGHDWHRRGVIPVAYSKEERK
jgi:hypothetical protein